MLSATAYRRVLKDIRRSDQNLPAFYRHPAGRPLSLVLQWQEREDSSFRYTAACTCITKAGWVLSTQCVDLLCFSWLSGHTWDSAVLWLANVLLQWGFPSPRDVRCPLCRLKPIVLITSSPKMSRLSDGFKCTNNLWRRKMHVTCSNGQLQIPHRSFYQSCQRQWRLKQTYVDFSQW